MPLRSAVLFLLLCTAAAIHERKAQPQTHFYNTVPVTEGNHNPSFIKGPDITVYEDFGDYLLGTHWASSIDDGNGNDHQIVHFELSNNNVQLFDVQPHINVCHPDCTCRCPNIVNCGAAGTCGCGNGCGAAQCGGGATCGLLHTGTLNFSVAANRFGVATVEVVLIDDGITAEVCNGPVTPTCTRVPCDRLPCTHSSVVEFKIVVLPVNDMPDFKHKGDVESPEDVEHCSTRWAYDITAGGWGEDWGQQNAQILTWTITNSNPNLFSTQPYLRYMQGDKWADLCYKPAPDAVGTATVEITLSDNGGDANGGIYIRSPSPEVVTITIYEVNDPPYFTPGPVVITVTEDSGPFNAQWATGMQPGPASEEIALQQLDRFDVEFVDASNIIKFTTLPTVNHETGFLQFEVAPDVNTHKGYIELTVYLWDAPLISQCRMCVPLRSLGPHPTIQLRVTPVNDPPSFTPPVPPSIVLTEDQATYTVQWASDMCIGGVVPRCVDSEADPHTEGQTFVFEVLFDGSDIVKTLTIDPSGLLTVELFPDGYGVVGVAVILRDTGEQPNTFANTTHFNVTVQPVNDPPYFNSTLLPPVVEFNEDSGSVVYPSLVTDLRSGPRNEEDQQLSFVLSVDRPDLFAVLPTIVPKWHANGRLHGDLMLTPADDKFGDADITFRMEDTGGASNKTETKEFILRINGVNDKPSFEPTALVRFHEDSGNEGGNSNHIINFMTNFTAGPYEDELQRVEYRLVPTPHVFVGLPEINAYGSLSFTVFPNWHGHITVALSGHDLLKAGADFEASLEADAKSFAIEILPVNDRPTFTMKDLAIRIPPCFGAQQCTHTVTNWLQDLSPGPYEEDQVITQVVTAIAEVERDGSLAQAPVVVEKDLQVTVKAGGGVQIPELHVITLTVKDNGGTDDGGHDTTYSNFTITVTVDTLQTPTPLPAVKLAVTYQPHQEAGTAIIGPTFVLLDSHDSPVDTDISSASLALVPEEGYAEIANTHTYSAGSRATFSWPELTIDGPGTFRFRAVIQLASGDILVNTTASFVVRPTAEVLVGFSQASITNLPDEDKVRKGLRMTLTLSSAANALQWTTNPGEHIKADIWNAMGNTELSVKSAFVQANTAVLEIEFLPLPTFDITQDGVLQVNVSSAGLASASRHGRLLAGVLIQTSQTYPLLKASRVWVSTSNGGSTLLSSSLSNGTQELILVAHGETGCCDKCTIQACCSGCFKRNEVDGYVDQVSRALRGQGRVMGLLTSAELTSPNTITIVFEGGPAFEPLALEIVQIADPAALMMARDVTPEVNGSGVQFISDITTRRVDMTQVDPLDLKVASIVVVVIFLLLSLLTLPFNFLLFSELGIYCTIASTTCQPPLSNIQASIDWLLPPLEGWSIVITVAFGMLHFLSAKLTRSHMYFPTLTASVTGFFLPMCVWSVFSDPPAWKLVLMVAGLVCVLSIVAIVTWKLWWMWKHLEEEGAVVWNAKENARFVHPTGKSELKKEDVKGKSFLEAYQSPLAGIHPAKSWFHCVEAAKTVLVVALVSYRTDSSSACGGQLLAAAVGEAVFLVLLFTLGVSMCRAVVWVRVAGGGLLVLALLTLGLPLLGESGSVQESAVGGWSSSEAFPVFLLLSLFVHTLLLPYNCYNWWQARSVTSSTPEKETEPRPLSHKTNPLATLFPENTPTPSAPHALPSCPSCGEVLDDDGVYCPSCGAKVTSS